MARMKQVMWGLVLVAGTGTVVGAGEPPTTAPGTAAGPATRSAMGPATRPTTQAAAEENPFIIGDVPISPSAPIRPEELARFGLADGFLTLQTSLTPQAPHMRWVSGLPQPVHVIVHPQDSMQLTYVQSEGGFSLRTSIFTTFNHLSLSRDIIGEGVERTIQFIQSPTAPMLGKATSLYIQNLNTDSPEGKQSYTAENFSTFVRMYPAETTSYVRPMLEVLGPQPQLFAVDEDLGSSVFPEAYAASPQEQAKIQQLVRELNADDFPSRQKAEEQLMQMGIRAAAALSAMDRSALQPEQAARIDAIISKLKPGNDADGARLRSDAGFLLDCLLSENANLRAAALSRLRAVTGQAVELEPAADAGERVKKVYSLRKQLLGGGASTRPVGK